MTIDHGRKVILTTMYAPPRIYALFDTEGGNPIRRRLEERDAVKILPLWKPAPLSRPDSQRDDSGDLTHGP